MGWQEVTLNKDVTPAAWIADRLHPFGRDVGSVVPTGFGAYARIPHEDGRSGLLQRDKSVALARILSQHSGACWFCLWDGYGYLHPGAMAWLVAARQPFAQIRRASKLLQLRWSRPKVSHLRTWPKVRLPGRGYLLFRGNVAQAAGWEDGPNLWWPDDRAWCVASEIDLFHTYVGGSNELIAELIADHTLGASHASVEDGIGINAPA